MPKSESKTPSYMKIQNYVFEKIRSGEYQLGSKIPSEIELAETFSVSRVTANKAIKEMSLMGVLERVRGRGTFVCSDQSVSTVSKAFGSAMKLDMIGSRKHQLVQFRVVKAYPELAEKAHVSEDELFYEIILVNKSLDKDESTDYTYIPYYLVDDIVKSLNYLNSHFVYDFLRTLPNAHPKFIKIFVNIPKYPFLQPLGMHPDSLDDVSIFSTDVYDANMHLLATTFTTYPSASHDTPLLTFAI
ncbi:MAG: GntR family transcriptional regulator [Christensenella sp.]|nr:GntR family transcriptional regulator [Christensenella sp.]